MDAMIYPSVLSAPLTDLGAAVRDMERAGADGHHVDVMDGHFVPNLTFGVPMVEALKHCTTKPLDVHLMVSNPEVVLPWYIQAGAHHITFHWEATTHHHRLLQTIRSSGLHAGIALNPSTPVPVLEHVLALCDKVLLMSVNPGFSGQIFLSEVLQKVSTLSDILSRKGLTEQVRICVDGGITAAEVTPLYRAGARGFVVGHAVYKTTNPSAVMLSLKHAATHTL